MKSDSFFLMAPEIIDIVDTLSLGVKNFFLYIIAHQNISTPYIPIPGIRQIVTFYKKDVELKKYFSKFLKEPYDNIDLLKNGYILLNYSGNLKKIKEELPFLPGDFILKRALSNVEEFGRVAQNLEKYLYKDKRTNQSNLKKISKLFFNIYKDSDRLIEIWKA